MRAEPDFKRRIGIDLNRRIGLEPGLDWAIAQRRPLSRHLPRSGAGTARPRQSARRAGARAARRARHHARPAHLVVDERGRELPVPVGGGGRATSRPICGRRKAIGAGWVIMHGGYHFTADKEERMEVAVARLARASKLAEDEGMTILLENMNPEPADAEVKYLVHDVEEAKFYFSRLTSPALRWAFTTNHAHMLPYGIEGFLDRMEAFGMRRQPDRRSADRRQSRHGRGASLSRHRQCGLRGAVPVARTTRLSRPLHAGLHDRSRTCCRAARSWPASRRYAQAAAFGRYLSHHWPRNFS